MRISIRYLLSLFLLIGSVAYAADTASILPPAKTTFFDQNGKPLTSGKVYFYTPGTTTFKTTWQDAAETTPNANPVILDPAGRAIVLGSGSYRQVVVDKNNNPVWDQVTSSAGSGGSGGVTVGDGIAVGTVLPWAGMIVPNNYALPYGQELSRTTYATLMGATSQITAVTCVSGSPILTAVADTSQINFTTSKVEAPCISGSASVIAKTASTITLSANAIVSVTTSATVFLYGNGNGVTTFNVPDFRGVVLPGRNNMGGSASSKITTSFYTDPDSTGGNGGSQSTTLNGTNLPAYSPAGTITVTNGAITNGAITSTVTGGTVGGSGSVSYNVTASGTFLPAPASTITVTSTQGTTTQATSTATFLGSPQGGVAAPFRVVQSSTTINYIIKILPDINLSIARCANLLDAGSSCTYNVGTSGATIPLLNTANTWSANQVFNTVNISGGTITGMSNPIIASDVANKAYVDSLASGLNILAQSTLATAAVLPNTPTYANGALGVGATLTAGSNSTLTVDGVVAALNAIVLVKNQASAFQNGIYTVSTAGSGAAAWVLTRVTYFDQAAEMKAGSYTFVTTGTTNLNSSWTLQTAVTTVGTDPSNWVLFAKSSNVITYSTLSGVSTTYTSPQCQSVISRSNSGSAMVDTIPGTGAGVLAASCSMTITNNDTSAILAIQVAAGATIKATTASTGYIYLCPQQSLSYYSDGSNYFASSQPSTCNLKSATTFYAVASGGSSTNTGLTASSPLADCQSAYSMVQASFNASYLNPVSQPITFQCGTVGVAGQTFGGQVFSGRIPGQGGLDTSISSFPVIIQGDTSTISNVTISSSTLTAISVYGDASLLIQGFTLHNDTAAVHNILVAKAWVAYRNVDFLGSGYHDIAATYQARIEVAGNYLIHANTGHGGSHWFLSAGSQIWVQANTAITISGTPTYPSGFLGSQYGGSNWVANFALSFAGTNITGTKCAVNSPSYAGGVASITVGSASTGNQCN